MQNEDLKLRTKRFALRVVKVYAALQKRDAVQQVLGRQMLRSGTSVGAQYREACRARSSAEFISKMNSALQELDETAYWFEMLVESNSIKSGKLAGLIQEAQELIVIFVASITTARRRGSWMVFILHSAFIILHWNSYGEEGCLSLQSH
jgi:four helix bundle protein